MSIIWYIVQKVKFQKVKFLFINKKKKISLSQAFLMILRLELICSWEFQFGKGIDKWKKFQYFFSDELFLIIRFECPMPQLRSAGYKSKRVLILNPKKRKKKKVEGERMNTRDAHKNAFNVYILFFSFDTWNSVPQ